jgi:hypothetical protein
MGTLTQHFRGGPGGHAKSKFLGSILSSGTDKTK